MRGVAAAWRSSRNGVRRQAAVAPPAAAQRPLQAGQRSRSSRNGVRNTHQQLPLFGELLCHFVPDLLDLRVARVEGRQMVSRGSPSCHLEWGFVGGEGAIDSMWRTGRQVRFVFFLSFIFQRNPEFRISNKTRIELGTAI
jgi:hypothetical protein